MLRDFVKTILELKKPETVKIGGIDYWTNGKEPIFWPEFKTMHLNTLDGLVQYFKFNRDNLDPLKIQVVVNGPTKLDVYSTVEIPSNRRAKIASVCCSEIVKNGFLFDRYQKSDSFIIGLQTEFVPNDHLKKVLQVVGNMQSENISTSVDDGVTQTVGQKVGVVLSSKAELPNPVELQPFRTFPEVEQPSSLFCLRVDSDRSNQISVGLFETSSGMWKLKAIKSIARYLRKHLPIEIVVCE